MMRVAIVGATGLVGRELVGILHERQFPLTSLKLLASAQSLGEKISFGEEELSVEELKQGALEGSDLIFFAVEARVSKPYIEKALKQGSICIDKSSAFRMESHVPLVVPEVNGHRLSGKKGPLVIASPNCTAVPVAQVLFPLMAIAPLKRVVLSSYQAVSGQGKAGVEELEKQVRDLFNLRSFVPEVFQEQIAFNILPFIPEEETKVVEELRKILELESLPIVATCARVPVFNGHSVALHVELQSDFDLEKVCKALAKAPGLTLLEEGENEFPTPLKASGLDQTLVGRVRRDFSVPYGLSLWLSSDNLRTGAALNAVRIAELVCLKSGV